MLTNYLIPIIKYMALYRSLPTPLQSLATDSINLIPSASINCVVYTKTYLELELSF